MSTKVDLSPEQFYRFVEKMKKDSFHLLELKETLPLLPYKAKIEAIFANKKSSTKHQGTGIQALLKYDSGVFVVLVLTTFVEAEGTLKDSDEAWVCMFDKRKPDKPVFYSFPIHRTKNFLKTLSRYAKAYKNRADTMPCCPECGTLLTIKVVHSGPVHAHTLVCPNGAYVHKKFKFCSVYSGMDDIHRMFLEKKFQQYDVYRKKNDEQGIIRIPSVLKRAIQKKDLRYDNNFGDPFPNYDTSQ
jgi:hypothetical protein